MSWKTLAGAALIVLLTTATYIPVMRGGFFSDDVLYITDNRLMKAGDGLYKFWFTTEAPDYYPVTLSWWWLQWRLWGNSATGYHVVNVLLHAIDAVLVWIVLRRLRIPGAWFAALVFAVHPVNVGTVAWISEQKNTLAMLFYAATVLFYLKFDEEGRWRWYGLSLAAFLLALLSKTAVVMLPLVLLGCVWWRRGHVRWKDILCSVPFFVLSLVLGLVTIWFQNHRALEGQAIRADGFFARLADAGWIPWFYLFKTFLPVNLSVIYRNWLVGVPFVMSYLPLVALVICFAVFWWKRRTWGRPALFASGYFVVMLFPVLGFFDQGFYQYSLVADHWLYFSIIGAISLPVAAGTALCHKSGEFGRYVGVAAGTSVIVALGVATWMRADLYADTGALWQDTLAKNPNAWVAHNNLGSVLFDTGKIQEAISHYEQALQLKPNYAAPYYNLGNALAHLGKNQEAIPLYEQAIRLKPNYAKAHNNLGLAFSRERKIEDAILQFTEAVRINPDYDKAHNNLGNTLWEAGKIREAVAEYEQALRINPDHGEALNNLAWFLATVEAALGGDPSRAVSLAQRACELTGNHLATYVDTLAAAYAAAGRFDEAINTAQDAIKLADSAGQTQLVAQVQAQLELFHTGRPYRERKTSEALSNR